MQSTRPETSPHKAGRRVLGEKTANASLTPVTKRVADVTSQKLSTTAIPFSISSNVHHLKPRDVSPEPCHAGQKRTIDQVVEGIKEAESAPRKALVASQPDCEKVFEIFDDDHTSTEAAQRDATSTISTPLLPNESSLPQKMVKKTSTENYYEGTKEGRVSRVPTEPAARKIFIQQRAVLARSRLQSAMRRVKDKSLDHALSQFEANSRPFLTSISSSPSNIQREQQTCEKSSPTKPKRVLLPPLPIQPRSRPVRSSAQTTAPSPSQSMTTRHPAQYDTEEQETAQFEEEDEDNEKTPRAHTVVRHEDTPPESGSAEVVMSQESDSLMDSLVKWTQSSAGTSRTIEA